MPEWLRDAGVANLIALVGAAGVLFGLGYAAATYRLGKRTDEREAARDAERERDARRARLGVYRDEDRLVVYNEGPGTAHDVRVRIDNKPISENKAVIDPGEAIPVLGPGAEYRFVTAVEYLFRNPTRPLAIEIRWTDDSGEPGIYATSLAYT